MKLKIKIGSTPIDQLFSNSEYRKKMEDESDNELGGLPSPPLDEADVFGAYYSTMDLCHFFNDIDDNGNIQDGKIFSENLNQKPQSQRRGKEMRVLMQVLNQTETSCMDPRPDGGLKSFCLDESTLQLKVESAKRKLRESYKEAEIARKKRRVQVIDVKDLPKQSICQKNHRLGPKKHDRPLTIRQH